MAVVIVPSIGCSSLLVGVVQAALASSATHVLVLENQNQHHPRHRPTAWDNLQHPTAGVRHTLCRQYWHVWNSTASLYDEWNTGMEFATKRGDGVAVILNDDIVITPETIDGLIYYVSRGEWAALGADYRATDPTATINQFSPRRVSGSYRHGGIGGFAFAVAANLGVRVDTQFEWWGGDDDLFFQLKDQGYSLGLLDGAWVKHPHPETSAFLFPELTAAKDRDRERMRIKWGDTWG